MPRWEAFYLRAAASFIALVLSLALTTVQAAHCTTWTTSTTNDQTLVLDTGTDGLLGRYVVNDLCNVPRYDEDGEIVVWFGHDFARVPFPIVPGDCLFSIWLYHETNGIEGLQRGDEVVDDSCHWMIEPDIFVW